MALATRRASTGLRGPRSPRLAFSRRSRRLARAIVAAEPTAVARGPAGSASRVGRATGIAAGATTRSATAEATATARRAAVPSAARTPARSASSESRRAARRAAASGSAPISLPVLCLSRLATRLAPLGRRGQSPLGVELLLGLTKHERAAALGARDLLVAHRGLSGDEGDAPFAGLGR